MDIAAGEVRRTWRLAGVPLWGSRQEIVAEGIELRQQWMRRLRVQGGSVKGVQKALVYDLVLVGHEDNLEEPPRDLVIDLKTDQLLFTLAERRARVVGEELDLPVAVRWDRLFDEVQGEARGAGEWRRGFAYPEEREDWCRWASW